ncbi:hypothetical protein PAXRUDRAFT_832811 [Paxillus rubicundulus Ve08.2h10]|uniref:Unplaced genomic scaffold scaffold_967, whole genome shotgun sequence n=1 Tax=Paxillus rubicundulus Ve08.2h10 TaxID=930991 RepID=A0A0D0DBN7_9AGAM|nr:hypothetical protein PAXRUDRAFT_832811 [Paxillus rubicundulus Ve08.2h10]
MAVEYPPVDVVTELHQLQFAMYLNVTALAVFLFDYCLTLSSEVRHVWGTKWETTRIIFTISRYLPFIASPMVCFYNLYGNKCGAYNYVIDVFAQGSVVAAEAVLVLRTYALWGHSRRVLVVLMALAAVSISPRYIRISTEITSTTSGQCQAFIIAASIIWCKVKFSLPGDSESTYVWYAAGCGSGALRNTAFRGVFLMAYEIILQSMNTWRKLRTYRNVQSRVLSTLYWDGIMYMFWIILLTAANTAVLLAAPLSYISSLDTTQVAQQSVFASRIFFNLRECDESIRDGEPGTEMSLDPLQFSPHSIGTSQSRAENSALRLA